MQCSAAAQVNIGKSRLNNEDNLYFNGIYLTEETREQPAGYRAEPKIDTQIYAVCDGMGGEKLGEMASLMAVQTISKYAGEFRGVPSKKTDDVISRCITEANDVICRAKKNIGITRTGTTLALLVLKGKEVFSYNVGDSRIYLLRGKVLEQLSEDHTSVVQSIKFGIIAPEQAKKHPRRNSLTQHLGIEPEEMIIEPYKAKGRIKSGDVFLLCSDGLTDTLDDSEIAVCLTENQSPAAAVSRLMDIALERGCKDNITVIVVRA